jgi:plastocyanin
MIWRSATCSNSAALFALLFACQYLAAATLEGRVRLVDSSNSTRDKSEDSGVVVWLTTPEDSGPYAIRKHARMLQKDKKFLPHILAIETGTIVDFPNLDPIFHNAFSNYDGTIFDVALYPPGSSRQVRFDRPGIVRVFCNIHPSMSAIIVVVNSTYFTTTGRSGRFSIPSVEPGQYEIHFFHERSTPETLEKLTHTVVVADENLDLGVVAISEAGYLPVAHKNKYGRDYPPNSDDVNSYSSPAR